MPVDAIEVERGLAEPDDVRADAAAAEAAGGEIGRGLVGVPIREGVAAELAAGLEEVAVHVVHTVGAGALVEIVDVLGTKEEAVSQGLLQVGEGEVGRVGLGGEGIAAAHGVEAPDEFGVGLPGLGGCDLLDAVAVPKAARAAKGCEAAFGGDAGAGEDEEAVVLVEAHGR